MLELINIDLWFYGLKYFFTDKFVQSKSMSISLLMTSVKVSIDDT